MNVGSEVGILVEDLISHENDPDDNTNQILNPLSAKHQDLQIFGLKLKHG